jgi:hypothetical protein
MNRLMLGKLNKKTALGEGLTSESGNGWVTRRTDGRKTKGSGMMNVDCAKLVIISNPTIFPTNAY